MKRFEYTSGGNENQFTSSLLIGKTILSFKKDGIGYSPIITTLTDPVNKELRYFDYSGNFTVAQNYEPGEKAIILYQDINSES